MIQYLGIEVGEIYGCISMVEALIWGQEGAGSTPATRTIIKCKACEVLGS